MAAKLDASAVSPGAAPALRRNAGFGIKAKLFLAFGGMALLTAGASTVAWYAFLDIERSVTRITAESIVGMAASLRLAEKSAEITATAPALIASRDDVDRAREQRRLVQRLSELAAMTEALRVAGVAEAQLAGLMDIEGRIAAELRTLNGAVEQRLRLSARRQGAAADLAALHARFQGALEPLVDDAGFDLVTSSEEVTAEGKEAITGLVEGGVRILQALLTLRAEGNLAAGLLGEAAHVDDPDLIRPIRERFSAAVATIERNLEELGQSPENARLREASKVLTVLGAGTDNLFEARSQELRALAETRHLLQAKREGMASAVEVAQRSLLDILTPLVDDASFNLLTTVEEVTAEGKEAITGLIDGGVRALQVLLTLRAEGSRAAGLLAEAAHVDDPALIQPIRERFAAAAATIERNLGDLGQTPANERLREECAALIGLGSGADSIFEARSQELRALGEPRRALQAKRAEMAAAAEAALRSLLETLTPMVDDASFDLVTTGEDVTTRSTQAITSLIEGGMSSLLTLLTLRADGSRAAGLLTEAAHVDDPALIQPIRERFAAAAATITRGLGELAPARENERLRTAGAALIALGSGADNIFEARSQELRALAETRRSLQSKREAMAAAVEVAHRNLLATLTPMVDDASFDLVTTSDDVTARSTKAITGLVEGGVSTLLVLLTLRAEGNLAVGLLNEAAGVPDPSALQPLQERFVAAASHAEKLVAQLPALANADSLKDLTDKLIAFGTSAESIFALRRVELRQTAAAQASLEANNALVLGLGKAVEELVLDAQRSSDAAALRTAEAIRGGKLLLLVITALSALGAALIAARFVVPRVVRPIERITAAMSGLAAGDTSIDVPGRERGDEIGRMAEALGVFRDTAVEVQKASQREIREGRRRLAVAIESISEGFSLYDGEDRLVVCNSRYRTLLYPDGAVEIAAGMTFESIVRRAAERGYIKDAEGRVEEWLVERMARHREPVGPHIQQRGDGRWILVSEHRTDDGSTVAVYSDITELKQRENQLADKSKALEQLSSQLAKYLSPQVYESIFTGKQEVKIASRRKKLTVFFSDIAGFTETTDRLESEDLTRLLNHYLTEMSRIALSHGATIDKYVGDAIVIFFGDPETRGVGEDALACVEMAIAMRKRMRELREVWRASGIEQAVQCRMGINTGYCTVGNFGGEDRMEYTIIGSGVNLASRLEAAATPGEILISYETYANVRHRIHCQEHGHMSVKGIAYPVATYQVVDTYERLGAERLLIHEERPNLRLDLDLEAMSADDRGHAAAVLRDALERLSSVARGTSPAP